MEFVDKTKLLKMPYGTLFYSYADNVLTGPQILLDNKVEEIFTCKPNIETVSYDVDIDLSENEFTLNIDSNIIDKYSEKSLFLILSRDEAKELILTMNALVDNKLHFN